MVNFRRPSYTRSKTCPHNTDEELHNLVSTTQVGPITPWEGFPSPSSPITNDHISRRGRTDSISYFPHFPSHPRPSLSSRDNTSPGKSIPHVEISPPIIQTRRKSSTYHRVLSYINLFHWVKKKEEEDNLEPRVGTDRLEEGYLQFPIEISRDTSEIEYLRRVQMESLESAKRAVAA